MNLTNDYVFRGISQTDAKPAIQASVGYTHNLGPYGISLSAWGSNVEFNDVDEATVEFDYTLDISRSVGGKNGVDLSGGFIYYDYPGATGSLNYDYLELYISASFDVKIASTTIGLNGSPDYFGNSGTFFYPYLDVSVPVGKYLDLSAHVGYNSIRDAAAFGQDSYIDYSFSLGANVAGVDVGLAYTDTDLEETACDSTACGSIVVSVSKSF